MARRAGLAGFFAFGLWASACITEPSQLEQDPRRGPSSGDAGPQADAAPALDAAAIDVGVPDSKAADLIADDRAVTDLATLDATATDLFAPDEGTQPLEEPPDLTHTPDNESAVTQAFEGSSGSVEVQAADGTRFVLELPAGSHFSMLDISASPTAVHGLPFSGDYAVAVSLTPEGLYFRAPATLRITPAQDPSGRRLVGFAFHQGRGDFHLVPTTRDQGDLLIDVSNFTVFGVAEAGCDEIAAMEGVNWQATLHDALTDLAAAQMGVEGCDEDEVLDYGQVVTPIFIRWYQQHVMPHLYAATQDPMRVEMATGQLNSWYEAVGDNHALDYSFDPVECGVTQAQQCTNFQQMFDNGARVIRVVLDILVARANDACLQSESYDDYVTRYWIAHARWLDFQYYGGIIDYLDMMQQKTCGISDIRIDPLGEKIGIGEEVQLVARALDYWGTELVGYNLIWESLSPDIVSVNSETGVAVGLAQGTSTVMAYSLPFMLYLGVVEVSVKQKLTEEQEAWISGIILASLFNDMSNRAVLYIDSESGFTVNVSLPCGRGGIDTVTGTNTCPDEETGTSSHNLTHNFVACGEEIASTSAEITEVVVTVAALTTAEVGSHTQSASTMLYQGSGDFQISFKLQGDRYTIQRQACAFQITSTYVTTTGTMCGVAF